MIYFDYASSTPVDEEILDSYNKILRSYFSNPSAIHKMGLETSSLLSRARKSIADILNVKEDEIIFTSGATESNNLAIKGYCFKHQSIGKHLITSKVEHSSVLNVFKQLEELGFDVTYLDVDSSGKINLNTLKENIRKDTILVSLMMVNNETGSINDIHSIYETIKLSNSNTVFHCDATQGFGKFKINFNDVDMLSMSAHKIYGLKGSGFLYKKNGISLSSLIVGGGQEFGLRSGTSNFPLDVMLSKTIRLAYEHMESDISYVKKLNERIRKSIGNLDTISINSALNCSPYILNISIKNKKGSIVQKYLEDKGIMVSTTSACSSKDSGQNRVILEIFKDENRASEAIRISFSKFNRETDVDELVEALKNIDIK